MTRARWGGQSAAPSCHVARMKGHEKGKCGRIIGDIRERGLILERRGGKAGKCKICMRYLVFVMLISGVGWG